MERKGPPISLDEFRRRFGNQTNPEGRVSALQQISAVQREAQQLMTATLDRLNQTSEDAYATRNEATKFINFLAGFSRKIATARPGSMVDLTKTVVDDGYDAEEDAAARDEGVDYRTEADRAEAEYDTHLYSVRTLLPRLRKAGVQVKVGFKRVFPQK